MLDFLRIQIQGLGNLVQFFSAEFIQVVTDDSRFGGILAALAFQLQEEALCKIPGRYARGIEFLHLFQHPLDFIRQAIDLGGDFVRCGSQISTVIEIADDFHCDDGILLGPGSRLELLEKMLGKRGRAHL